MSIKLKNTCSGMTTLKMKSTVRWQGRGKKYHGDNGVCDKDEEGVNAGGRHKVNSCLYLFFLHHVFVHWLLYHLPTVNFKYLENCILIPLALLEVMQTCWKTHYHGWESVQYSVSLSF